MFTTASPLLSNSGLSVDQLNQLLSGKGVLNGLGQAFKDVEYTEGVNALFGIAQAALETGWGTSAIATQKNNLFGITAYDSNPFGDASTYASPAACVAYWGKFITENYLTPGGVYFNGDNPAGVAKRWASDPNYASKIVNIMNLLISELPANTVTPPTPVAPASGRVYTVVEGDNMSVIAQREGLTLSQLESANPQAGHPAGNFGVIWAGDHLVIPTASEPTPPPAPAPQRIVYTVQSGDSLSSIAAQHGLSLAQIEQLNPAAGHPSGNFDVIWVGDKIYLS